jgi:anti-sigma regulatory factor (Ser/Thr protein kinase)
LTAEELEFELAGGPYAATAARLALSDLEDRLDGVLAQDLRLLVSEVVTNSVRHAGIGSDDSLGLRILLDEGRIRVEITDGGPQFEVEPRRPSLEAGEEDEVSGWGLFLVEQLADRWGVQHEDGNRVWFELGTGGGESAAA